MFNFIDSSKLKVSFQSSVSTQITNYNILYVANLENNSTNYSIKYTADYPDVTIQNYSITYTSEYQDAVTLYRIRYTANKELISYTTRYTIKYGLEQLTESLTYYSVKYFCESSEDTYGTLKYTLRYTTQYLTPINNYYRIRYLAEGLNRKVSLIRYKLRYTLDPIYENTVFYSLRYSVESSGDVKRILRYKVKYSSLGVGENIKSYLVKYTCENYSQSIRKYRIRYNSNMDSEPTVQAVLLSKDNEAFDALIRISSKDLLTSNNSFVINDEYKYKNLTLIYGSHNKAFFKTVAEADILPIEEVFSNINEAYNYYYFILRNVSTKVSLDFAIMFNNSRLNSYTRFTYDTNLASMDSTDITINGINYIYYNSISSYSNKNELIYNSDIILPRYVVAKDCCFSKKIGNTSVRSSCSPV